MSPCTWALILKGEPKKASLYFCFVNFSATSESRVNVLIGMHNPVGME